MRMLCLGGVSGGSSYYSIKCFQVYDYSRYRGSRFLHPNTTLRPRWRFMALESESSFASSTDSDATDKNASASASAAGCVFKLIKPYQILPQKPLRILDRKIEHPEHPHPLVAS